MKYTTYLFDFDYTLADSSRGIVICFRNVLERHGHTGISDEAIKRTIGKTLEDSFSILSGITAPETLAAYKKEYIKEADTYMTANTFLFPETESVLKALKSQGVKIGIISTKFRYRIREMVDQHFPEDFFDIIIGGEDVKKAKPNPQGIKKALRQMHRQRNETLYIGDSTVDAETAQLAKVDFAGVLNGMTTRDELAAYPHRQILDNLSLLPLVQG
ncbi:pyrophosphatase PpaX [Bacteroidaceae bacterium]|nr:HAD-IA family hydrolase [uncultured Phocaeicola sp.]GFH99898.1 pyrophosphatase PpaX [Bacteroidaceae bacterium]